MATQKLQIDQVIEVYEIINANQLALMSKGQYRAAMKNVHGSNHNLVRLIVGEDCPDGTIACVNELNVHYPKEVRLVAKMRVKSLQTRLSK